MHPKIKHELIETDEWLIFGGKKVVQLSFASILGQSRAAAKCLFAEFKLQKLEGAFNVWYAPGPRKFTLTKH